MSYLHSVFSIDFHHLMLKRSFIRGVEPNPNTVLGRAQIMGFCQILILYKYFKNVLRLDIAGVIIIMSTVVFVHHLLVLT